MSEPDARTTSWTSEQLAEIDAADELRIAPRRRDGSLRAPVPIWAVRVGDDVFVRAAYGPDTGWHRVAQTSREAHVSAGGAEADVTIADAGEAVNGAVDAAYRTKYQRYSSSIVDGITNDQARASTLKLVPRV